MDDTIEEGIYQSEYTEAQLYARYPTIDASRLGWALVVCIFLLGLPM